MPRVVNVAYLGLAAFVISWLVAPTSIVFASIVTPQAPAESRNFENLAANAQSAREAGKLDEAIRNYQAAVELRPNWEEGWWYLGTLLYDNDHFAEAVPALRRMVELDSNSTPGWAFLGLCEFEIGDYTDSFTHLQSAMRLGFSDSPEIKKIALYHLGLLLNLRGEFERATDLLVNASGPGAVPEQIKTALGLALLRVPILPAQVDPGKDALIHAAGDTAALLLNQQMDAASANFEQMLRDYPGTPYLHYQYGLALVAASQDQRAELQFREEIQAKPSDALSWIALATLNTRRKKFAEAMAAAQHAIELAPRSAAAYEALGQALHNQGKSEQAATALQRAHELANQPAEVELAQVRRYALSKVTDFAKNPAGNDAAKATQSNSSATDLHETARSAESARQNGHLEEAAALYQQALKFHPEWQEGWRQLGTIEYMQAHYPKAIAALQQSVALDSRLPDTWTLLGLSEFEIKDYKNSRIHLERGRVLGFSGNAAAVRVSRYHLALLLNRDGDYDGAFALLIPEVGPGALSEEIQFAMGIALLRIPSLPEQIDPVKRTLVRSAGEAAVLLSGSYYDKAFQIFDRILSSNPETPFVHYAYGDALASVSRYDAAQFQLREETRVNPRSELAYIRLASIALVLHQSASALENASKAAALAPESAGARYVLGRALLEQGNVSAAIRELEAARRLSPNSPKVHFNLARAYTQANRIPEAEQERAEFERLKDEIAAQPSSYGDRRLQVNAGDASMQ